MKSIKCLLTLVLTFIIGIGVSISQPSFVFATGNKGAWAILTDPNVRWVAYPGSNGALLYDRETGLTWEQHPSDTEFISWIVAAHYCWEKTYMVNGRAVAGFRLPMVPELTNLARDLDQFDGIQLSINQPQPFIQIFNNYVTGQLTNRFLPGLPPTHFTTAVRFMSTGGVEIDGSETDGSSGNILAFCVRGGGPSVSGDWSL